MKASSGYPVLDNRPIDQWKVTELKEELKRRKLITRGLKEELVKRLDEDIRKEMESQNQDVDNGVEEVVPDNSVEAVATVETTGFETSGLELRNHENVVENVGAEDGIVEMDDVSGKVEIEGSIEQSVEEQQLGSGSDQVSKDGTLATNDVPPTDLGNEIGENVSSEKAVDLEGLSEGKKGMETGIGNEGPSAQEQTEEVTPLHEDGNPVSSDSIIQVSEVSSSLGFPVKSNSISTDSVSYNENEKNELKDNIIADNVKLESDVKPEMVQPSSSDLVPDGGESHPSDVEEPHENKVYVQDTDTNVTNADVSQKNYSADLGSEKLNLDRSSGDDSMEEDALESKHIDSNYNSEEVVEKTEKNEVATSKEEIPVHTVDIDVPVKEKGTRHDDGICGDASSNKRKFSDQEAVLNNEPTKRQHRWKTESNSFKEPPIPNLSPKPAVKDMPQHAVLKRNLSGSQSTGGVDEPPKEREVPPSSKPATNSLRIDRFLRPFTLKAVQELLAKTGNVSSFWMDHIKTHCYVTYSSVEEAVETRNAVYNLQWPPNGGRQLVAEFVDPEEVEARLQPPPPPPAAPVSSGPMVPEPSTTIPQASPRQQSLKQQMAQQHTLPPPPPMTNVSQARERALPPPPPQTEKVEAPIVTLDDLFKKTKASPRIYYLPLSEEQVSTVIEARRRNSTKQ